MRSPIRAGGRAGLTLALVVTALLAGSVGPFASAAPTTPVIAAPAWFPNPAPSTGPRALIEPGLGLRAGPVALPLEVQIPRLMLTAGVVGVGITDHDAMDAPMGPPGDPVWHQVFWYRGSAIPGARSTAVIAGHVDGGEAPAAFAHLDQLQPGDPIFVHDTRDGSTMRFTVRGSQSIPLDETTGAAALARIYGVGPVAGTRPQASIDGLAHLTLITCSGTFRDGTHDHRFVVDAIRTD
jgi:hypothetical protein